MQYKIIDKTIYFYNNDGVEIMYIDYSTDECIWHFSSSDVIEITSDNVLYPMLVQFMNQNYIFFNEVLENKKEENKLLWFSDCYFNPDDAYSVASVSSLNIEYKDDIFYVWCNKELDKKIKRPNQYHSICFSPCGNGQYSRNIDTGLTLQDDFVSIVYHSLISLMKKQKTLKKNVSDFNNIHSI